MSLLRGIPPPVHVVLVLDHFLRQFVADLITAAPDRRYAGRYAISLVLPPELEDQKVLLRYLRFQLGQRRPKPVGPS